MISVPKKSDDEYKSIFMYFRIRKRSIAVSNSSERVTNNRKS